jgi:hypothetical protein
VVRLVSGRRLFGPALIASALVIAGGLRLLAVNHASGQLE